MTQSITTLTTLAIKAAQESDWGKGKEFNSEILIQEPDSIEAMNRLAFCEMQLNNTAAAKKIYEQVLSRDRINPIATKYLQLLKRKVQITPPTIHASEDFIEEPGKTKSVLLQRLAEGDVLQSVAVATPCTLWPKNHRIDVKTESGLYLGSLPDDIAFRLQKLIKLGNTYKALVQSTTKNSCALFIKEVHRSPEALNTASFPTTAGNHSLSLQEDVLLDEPGLEMLDTPNEPSNTDEEAEGGNDEFSAE